MKNSPKAIAVQQRQRNDFLRVSDGDSEGIIPPMCALCMNWSNAERKSESDVLMTDCPRGLPAVSSANKKLPSAGCVALRFSQNSDLYKNSRHRPQSPHAPNAASNFLQLDFEYGRFLNFKRRNVFSDTATEDMRVMKVRHISPIAGNRLEESEH